MGDLALTWDPQYLAADLVIEGNDLLVDDGLRGAVACSLYEDRRAEPGDTLPDGQTDRRGWWGDAFPAVDGDKIGSRLWLLARSKQLSNVIPLAEAYAREALRWLLEDRVASQVDVTASFPTPGVFALEVSIWRPAKDSPTVYRFSDVWSGERVS